MPIFTLPLVLTVNTVAHSFNERYQRYEGGSQVAEYYEPAANLLNDPRIIIKQDLKNKTADRALAQFSIQELLPDGVTYKPIIVNFTMWCNPLHSLAQRDNALEHMAAIVASQSFRDGFSQRLV
jgi:hypothetical protein